MISPHCRHRQEGESDRTVASVRGGTPTPPTPIRRRGTVDVAFVVPRNGPAGLYGPSCEACGTLAVEEINAGGGLLGREVRLRALLPERPDGEG